MKPPIFSPIRCDDHLYRLCRETPTGHGQPYAQPTFAGMGYAAEYCRQVNEQAGRIRDEVVMARLRVKEITEVTPEEPEVTPEGDEVITEIII